MPADESVPGSPGWWLKRLSDAQSARRSELDRLERYYLGDHDLPEGDTRVREVYRQLQQKSRTNYVGLVVESVLERLRVTGFRAGGESDAGSDRDAWRIWQANGLDADAPLVHRAALSMREAYVIVGPPTEDAPGVPLITPEDPREVIAEMDPIRRRRPQAALKTWIDAAEETAWAVVYLPESVAYFTAPSRGEGNIPSAWEPLDVVRNPIGQVPVVRFPNRLSRLNGAPRAEFEDVLDVQDRINSTILDRLVISRMQAYRQRWAKGVKFEDEDGNPIEPFTPGVDLLWAVDSPDAAFGDFQETNIAPILSAVEADIRDLAALTRTPPHYLLGQIVNASGEALTAAETGLVAKVLERQLHFGEAWEQVIRLAYAYLGDERADTPDSEVIWADPQSHSVAELADAAIKEQAAGVPWRTRMVRLGFTPQQIDRMESERAAEQLSAAFLAPQLAPPAPPAPVPATEGVS